MSVKLLVDVEKAKEWLSLLADARTQLRTLKYCKNVEEYCMIEESKTNIGIVQEDIEDMLKDHGL